MSVLEDRYRSLLRLLPASYRAVWEEQMVATFLESVAVEDPEEAEYLADFGRPSWSEVASVVALAVRLRLGGVSSPPRSFAWGEAVRRVALIGLLYQAMIVPMGLVGMLGAAGMIPWLPPYPDGAVLLLGLPPDLVGHLVWTLFGLVWVAVYLALVFGRHRTAKLLALLAFAPFVVDLLTVVVREGGRAADAGDLGLGWAFGLGVQWLHLLVYALPLLALVAFHRDTPPVPRRPWLIALGVVLALSPILPLVFVAQPDPSWWSLLVDEPGLWSLALVAVAVVHLTRRVLGRARRSPVWPLALAMLAPAVLLQRVLSLSGIVGFPTWAVPESIARALIAVGMVEAIAVLTVGIFLAVLAAQELRRLPPAPAEAATSYTPTR